MADSTILREYLVALGFQVNEPDARKFDKRLVDWDKRATVLSRGLAGVAVAAQAMVVQFSLSMERLYYSSRRAESAASNLKALDFGARQIGVQNITESIQTLARNLRSNPGLTGLLESLGVPVRGRDKAEVMTDLVAALRRMPFYVAERYANLFGIDPDSLLLMQEGLEEMKKAAEFRKETARAWGVDTDAAALAGKEYAQSWREITEYVGIFKDALLLQALPAFQEMASVMKLVLADWTQIIRMDAGEFWDKLREGLGLKEVGGGVKLSQHTKEGLQIPEEPPLKYASTFPKMGPDGKVIDPPAPPMAPQHKNSPSGWFRQRFPSLFKESRGAPVPEPAVPDAPMDSPRRQLPFTHKRPIQQPPVPGPQPEMRYAMPPPVAEDKKPTKAAELFRRLEMQYALPEGLLDRIWGAESNRGDPRFMRSSAGAKGHFQFMDATAKDMGVTDPDDLTDSAAGAAKYMAQLIKRYDGDVRKAAAAYNWGMGNVDRYGLGAAPRETREYMDKVGGPDGAQAPVWNQTNNINVTGAGQPAETAQAIRGAISEVNSDAIRNFRPKVQ